MSESFAERVERTASQLGRSARALSIFVSGDNRISERDAAALLGYTVGHLRAMRAEGRAPRAFNVGMNGARRSYRICDVAEWIETQRDNG